MKWQDQEISKRGLYAIKRTTCVQSTGFQFQTSIIFITQTLIESQPDPHTDTPTETQSQTETELKKKLKLQLELKLKLSVETNLNSKWNSNYVNSN